MIRLAGAALLLCACIPDQSPVMRPGEDCLRCHDGGRARQWTLAGTVFASPTATVDQGVEGVSVTVTDAQGKQLTLVSNGAGNFYTAESLAPPFAMEIDYGGQTARMAMPQIGACNSCHTDPPLNGAPGRLYTP